MKKLLQKITLGILSFVLLFTSLLTAPSQALAQEQDSTWYNQPFTEWYSKVYGEESPPNEIFGERYTAAQVQWIVYSLIALPLNMDQDTQKIVACTLDAMNGTVDAFDCGDAIINKMDTLKEYVNPLLSSNTTVPDSFLASVFYTKNRSLSGIGYIKNSIGKFHIIPEAQAQAGGFGYDALSPIQKYWSGARDIAFALIVLVVIVFSFMIMFRVKISPQLVISVQSALPKVFLALILVTFSYAIAGFAIDLMYVIGGLMAMLIKVGGFTTLDFGQVYGDIFPPNQTGLYFLFHMIAYDFMFLIGIILNLLAIVVGLNVFQLLPAVLLSIMLILVVIWVLILSFVYTFKATWMLIKTLISVYISIITAPIQFVLGAVVPSMSFGNWFKKIMADLLVFPVTGVFMFFAWRLVFTSYKFAGIALANENIFSQIIGWFRGEDPSFFGGSLWVPEILGFGQATSGFIILMMSFGIIVALPKIPDILKMFLLGEKFAFGTAMGEAMGPIQWGQRQVMGSPVYRTFQEGFGYTGAANLLNYLEDRRWGKNLLRRTSRFTGISDETANAVAANLRVKAQQKKPVGG